MAANLQPKALPGQVLSRARSDRQDSAVSVLRKSLSQPYTYLLFVLTLSLLIWGFADRLTRYKNHPDPAKRTLVARFWVEQQDTTREAAVKLHSPTPSIVDHVLTAEPEITLSHRFVEAVLSAPQVESQLRTISPLLPFRSPPSFTFAA